MIESINWAWFFMVVVSLVVIIAVIISSSIQNSYSIGGILIGDDGATDVYLTLLKNGIEYDNMTLNTDGIYTFKKTIKNGIDYSVTAEVTNNPNKTAIVNNSSGTVNNSNVTNVTIELVDILPP